LLKSLLTRKVITIAFSSDGKAEKKKFIDAEIHKQIEGKQEGEDDASFEKRKRDSQLEFGEDGVYDLWKSKSGDFICTKLKAYWRDV